MLPWILRFFFAILHHTVPSKTLQKPSQSTVLCREYFSSNVESPGILAASRKNGIWLHFLFRYPSILLLHSVNKSKMCRENTASSYDQSKKLMGKILVSNQFQHRAVMYTSGLAKGHSPVVSAEPWNAQGCWAAKGKRNASVWLQCSTPADKS